MNNQTYNLLLKNDLYKIPSHLAEDLPAQSHTILIILDLPLQELSEDIRISLTKMTEALKLKPEDVAYYHLPVRHLEISEKFGASLVVIFGWSAEQMGMQCKQLMNVPLRLDNRSYLFTNDTDSLRSTDEKKQLWAGLQVLFKLK